MKCYNKMLQNLSYSWNMQFYFAFLFLVTLLIIDKVRGILQGMNQKNGTKKPPTKYRSLQSRNFVAFCLNILSCINFLFQRSDHVFSYKKSFEIPNIIAKCLFLTKIFFCLWIIRYLSTLYMGSLDPCSKNHRFTKPYQISKMWKIKKTFFKKH